MTTKKFLGEKYGRLLVIGRLGLYAQCQCDCGATCTPRMDKLRDGTTKSCGCLARELSDAARVAKPVKPPKPKRSKNEQRLRQVHSAMIQRCTNPRDSSWEYYGGRGIRIAAEWLDADVFIAWALPRYRPGLWLERRDNDGPYSPDNCALVSPKRQGRNRRNTLWVQTDDVPRSLAHVAAYAGWEYNAAYRHYCHLLKVGTVPHSSHFPHLA